MIFFLLDFDEDGSVSQKLSAMADNLADNSALAVAEKREWSGVEERESAILDTLPVKVAAVRLRERSAQ